MASPSPTGLTTPSATVATRGSLDDHSIAPVTCRPTSPPVGLAGRAGAGGSPACSSVHSAGSRTSPSSARAGGRAASQASQDEAIVQDQDSVIDRGSTSSAVDGGSEQFAGSRDGRNRPAGRAGRPGRGAWSRGRGPGCGRSSPRRRPARRAGRPGTAPIGSLAPTTRPPLTPPPAKPTVKHCGQWSRPPAGFTRGRPAELGQVADQGRVEQPPLVEVLDQGACRPGRTSGRRCPASPRST